MHLDKFSISSWCVFVSCIGAGFMNFPIIAYVFLGILALFYFKTDKEDRYLIASSALVLVIIAAGNFISLHNYMDLTIKGLIKLIFFILLVPAATEFFCKGFLYRMQSLRLLTWSLLFIGIALEGGIDLQNVQQFFSIFLVAIIEYVNAVLYKKKLGLFLAILLVVITTKKQLIFGVLAIPIVFWSPVTKKILIAVLGGIILVALGFGTERSDAAATGRTSEKRIESLLSERFITPDPYGNMRLYLVAYVIPKTFENNTLLGFGLERYGSVAAYESHRDVESTQLGMSKFIGAQYGGDETGFGSVAADVGLVTIFAQMGILGLMFYFLLIMYPRKNNLPKTLLILFPFFLGGPLVLSVTFPLLVGVVAATSSILNKKTSVLISGNYH